MTPSIEYMKKGTFQWISTTNEAYGMIKKNLCEAHIFVLPDFDKLFDIKCDANEVGIGTVLNPKSPCLTLVKSSMKPRGGTLLMIKNSMP